MVISLVIFREEEYATLPIDKIFVLNKAYDTPVNPADFLALQANDAPFFLFDSPLLKPTSSNALHAARWRPFPVVPLNSNPTNWLWYAVCFRIKPQVYSGR